MAFLLLHNYTDFINFIEKTYKYVLHIGLDKKERLKKTEKELLNS